MWQLYQLISTLELRKRNKNELCLKKNKIEKKWKLLRRFENCSLPPAGTRGAAHGRAAAAARGRSRGAPSHVWSRTEHTAGSAPHRDPRGRVAQPGRE